jgi:uncharacterized protein with PQ loop repeat
MAKKKHKHMSSRKLVGYIMLAVAFIAPLSNLPQIYKLFTLQVTEGLSVETWIMYLVLTVVQLAYAYVNNIRPLIISNILWIIVDLIMIYGIVAFGISSSPPEYEQLLLANNIGKAMGGLALLMISSAAALFAYDLMHVDQPKTKRRKHKYAA